MTSYAELVRTDKALAAFIQGEIGRAGVDCAALKAERAHTLAVIEDLQRQVAELRAQLPKGEAKKSGRRA